MVDVSGKAVTAREARATCRVRFPADVARQLKRNGLRSAKGNVLICLTANSKAFPDCSKDANAIKRVVKANAAGSVVFVGAAPGTYALSLIHDENGNGKLDTAMAIPREGSLIHSLHDPAYNAASG